MATKSVSISGGAGVEKALLDIAKRIDKAGTLRVGFLEGATYPDGTSVPMVAAIQNFGAPAAGIPARPFFSNVVASGKETWGDDIAKIAKATDYDGDKVLHLMGERIRGQVQQSIRDTNTPALKPATAARKGFPKPLIDTSVMINSVDYEVDE